MFHLCQIGNFLIHIQTSFILSVGEYPSATKFKGKTIFTFLHNTVLIINENFPSTFRGKTSYTLSKAKKPLLMV